MHKSYAYIEKQMREHLKSSGVPEDEVDRFVEQQMNELRMLDSGTCPKCGGPIRPILDSRQVGPTLVRGEWHKYRCVCGYMCDRVIEVQS